jgi:hypothetical protein
MPFAGAMPYVVCKTCGDAVAGRLPQGDELPVVTCVHCNTTFEFEDGERQYGVVEVDSDTMRWKVVTLRSMLNSR